MTDTTSNRMGGDSVHKQCPAGRGAPGWTLPLCWGVAVAATVVLSVVALWFGDLNQDEGWYLYAAREVAHSRFPYLDFATTQGPVMPFVYALGAPLVARWGVLGGRIFTMVLGWLAACGAGWLAAELTAGRHRRRVAALIAFALVGVNVYQCYFAVIVKTYALCAVLLLVGFVALVRALATGRKGVAAAGGVLMALAAGTRSSAGFAGLAIVAGLAFEAWRWRSDGADRNDPIRAAVPAILTWFAVAAVVTGLALFGPFLLLAPRGIWFALVEYHAGRDVGGPVLQAAYKAGFVSRVAAAYLVAVALLLCGLVRQWLVHGGGRAVVLQPAETGRSLAQRLAWLAVALVSLVHVAAPFPYDDYQVIVYPLFAAALGAAGPRWFARVGDGNGNGDDRVEGRRRTALGVAVVALCLLAAGASPLTWQWFLGERDRIWWPLKEQTPLAALREAGAFLRERTDEGELLLTQDTYLAVEAGLRVPRGLELGPFGYFPDWPVSRARARHVVNRETMTELLEQGEARYAAFSGYGLAIRCPEIAPLPPAEAARLHALVSARYEPIRRWARFGQAATELTVFRRRDDDP